MLSRRVPAAPPVQAPSALPPHLQRAMTQIPRSSSPTTTHVSSGSVSGSRPSSPAPYKSRQPNRPQTPVQVLPPPPPVLQPTDVEVDLVVDEIMDSAIRIEEPFSIRFTATVAAFTQQQRKRLLNFAVQHVIYSRPKSSANSPPTVANRHTPSHTYGHSPTPSGASTPRVLSIDFHPSLVTSPQKHTARKRGIKTVNVTLPSPYSEEATPGGEHHPPIGTGKVEFLGTSLIKLPAFELTSASEPMDVAASGKVPEASGKRISSQSFVLDFFPVKQGHANIGGIRLLLLNDDETDDIGGHSSTSPAGEDQAGKHNPEAPWRTNREPHPARTLHEWPVIAEVWVGSG